MYQRLDILLIVFRIEFVSLCCRASLIHVKMSKRKICNLDTKIKILKELEKNVKQCDVAKSYNISKQCVSLILKNKDKIFEAYSKYGPKTKKLVTRFLEHKSLDTTLSESLEKQIESVYLKNINQKKLTDYFTVNI